MLSQLGFIGRLLEVAQEIAATEHTLYDDNCRASLLDEESDFRGFKFQVDRYHYEPVQPGGELKAGPR